MALVYFPALRFPQSRVLPVYTHRAPLTFFFFRFQTEAGAFKIVFCIKCKQVLLLLKKEQNKTKQKQKKIERNVAFYLHIRYTKRGYKI